METNKEKWMMQVLDTKNDNKELPLSKHLLNQLYHIPKLTIRNEKIEFRTLFYLAASVLVVLGLNLFSWFSQNLIPNENAVETFQYFNYLNHF
jgi:hypothetical protein